MIRTAATLAAVVVAGAVLAAAAASTERDAITPTRIASDPLGDNAPGAHASVVEPSAVAVGSTIVAAFQVGRNFGGGAAAIGYATSTDRGASWQSGLLPGLTTWTPAPGPRARASDPVVAYDAVRRRYLIASLGAGGDITVSSSADGVAWSAPISAGGGFVDKEWITCDAWAGSPHRGRCYLAFTRFDPPGVNLRIEVHASTDGGASWGPGVVIPLDNSLLRLEDTVSAQPVVRPNGELVLFFFEGRQVRASRSADGGATFGPREAVAELAWRTYSFAPDRLRAPNIPSVAVDDAGSVYAAWSDCRFRTGCAANDIVLSRSTSPGAWTAPERVPLGPTGETTDFVLPAIAVQPETRGAGAHIALAYYSLSAPDCGGEACDLAAGFATSLDAGRTWRIATVGGAMKLDWLAPTNIGRMVGDYVAALFVPGRAVGIFSLAGPKQGGRFDQAAYAASAPLALPPRNTGPPRIVGPARVARTVTCRRGAWSGTPPLRFAYTWLRGRRVIRGAAAATYRVKRLDTGALLACRVRATNDAGTTTAASHPVRIRG